jgi:hypothetical protein
VRRRIFRTGSRAIAGREGYATWLQVAPLRQAGFTVRTMELAQMAP